MSTGTDFYRQRLATAKWSWREDHAWHQGKFAKDRSSGRAEKRGARQVQRHEISNDNADVSDVLSGDPCRNGTCAFCHDGGDETDFERTRMAAAQRGAI